MPRPEPFDDDEISGRAGRGSPADGFGEFIGRRRRNEAVERRALILSACLGGACLILAMSNIVLALRLTAPPLPAERAAVVPAPAVLAPGPAAMPPADAATVDVARVAEDAQPSAAAGGDTRSAPVAPVEPRQSSPPESAIQPPAIGTRSTPSAAPGDLPPRSEPKRMEKPHAPADIGSARRTATWMIDTYGRTLAEQRVRAAANFYSPGHPGGEYWRSVLVEMRSL